MRLNFCVFGVLCEQLLHRAALKLRFECYENLRIRHDVLLKVGSLKVIHTRNPSFLVTKYTKMKLANKACTRINTMTN